MGRIGSAVWVSTSLKKCQPHGSVRVRTPPRGRQGRCSAGRQRPFDRADMADKQVDRCETRQANLKIKKEDHDF